MARWQILVPLLVLMAITPTPSSAQYRPVYAELATMVEEVVAETGISINISESTPTSVNINQVNGRDVCSAEARADVERLQHVFDVHSNIHMNIGPALITITDRTGKKFSGDRRKLEKEGIFKGCSNIYVSVHE